MADIHGSPGDASQMPQASNAGSAPVPYGGPDLTGVPAYAADLGPMGDAAGEVMNGIPLGGVVSESPAAHSIAAGLADAPYAPGNVSPIFAGGDADAGGRDDVSGTVAGAVANATARWQEFAGDNGTTGTPGAGGAPVHAGSIGDLMMFPPNPLDPGVGSLGNTDPMGAFYDPPREYT